MQIILLSHERFLVLKALKDDLSLAICSKDGYLCDRYAYIVDSLTGEIL